MITTLMILAFSLGLVVLSFGIYGILHLFDFKLRRSKNVSESVNEIDKFKYLPSKYYMDFYKNSDFINKKCVDLEEFIVNENLTSCDLVKLAELNRIPLQVSAGWHPLIIELINKLDASGWDLKVTCIKEKFASLRFYVNSSDNIINKIISEYAAKSEYICETCGEKGEVRSSDGGWLYAACRRHYLENRNVISIEKNGFTHNKILYKWTDIRNMRFEQLESSRNYDCLEVEFYNEIVKISGIKSNKLYIYRSSIGFGNFLRYFNENRDSLKLYYINWYNEDYIKKYITPEFCEICGYQAVYNDKCECCENSNWLGYNKSWKQNENEDEEKKYEYIKINQMSWIADEGEVYQSKQDNYSKNPDYRILFTEDEYEKYIAEDDYSRNLD